MSINKSQSQTLSVAGLNIEENCFSFGQLYVGYGSHSNLWTYTPFWKKKKKKNKNKNQEKKRMRYTLVY